MKLWIICFVVICILARIFYSLKNRQSNRQESSTESSPKKVIQKTPKTRSYNDWKKRSAKKKYLSEHSEYITIPLEYVQQQVLKAPEQNDIINSILDAIMDGKNYVKIKRSDWDRINSTAEQK